jgi:hypothetical protein
MKNLFLLLPLLCRAQSLTPALSEPFAYPGSTINLQITLNDTTPTSSITAVQFTPVLPAGFTLGTPTGATCAAGVCSATNSTPYVSQQIIATIPVTIASNVVISQQSIGLSPVSATNASGAVPITAPNQATISVVASTGTTPWFSFAAGNVTCKASKVAQLPIHISFSCTDPYGGMSGSYTANGGVGANQAGNNFTLSMNSLGIPNYNSAFCMIYINATSVPIMIPGSAVQANSAAYQCSGTTATGVASVSWP